MERRIYTFLVAAAALWLSSPLCAEVMMWEVNDNPVSTDRPSPGQSIDWTFAVLRATQQSSAEAAIYQGQMAVQEKGLTDAYAAGDAAQGSVIASNFIGADAEGSAYGTVVHTSVFEDGAMVVADLESLTSLGLTTSELYFYVELYDESQMLVGFSSAKSYAALSEFRNSAIAYVDWNTYNAWNPSEWTAVPEPTGTLLLMLGLAVAGLRRGRAA